MGWPGIYSICFSQIDGGKDSFSLDRGFSALIDIRLIRDNEGKVIENYPTSLMMRFGLIYRIWAFQTVRTTGSWGEQTGLPFWAGARGPGVSMSLPFSWAW